MCKDPFFRRGLLKKLEPHHGKNRSLTSGGMLRPIISAGLMLADLSPLMHSSSAGIRGLGLGPSVLAASRPKQAVILQLRGRFTATRAASSSFPKAVSLLPDPRLPWPRPTTTYALAGDVVRWALGPLAAPFAPEKTAAAHW